MPIFSYRHFRAIDLLPKLALKQLRVIQTTNISIDQQRFSSSKGVRKLKTLKRMSSVRNSNNYSDDDEYPFDAEIAHGESVVDRKSVFQGHCAAINRVDQVEQFLSKLKENKKIENAFHNMWAYRVDKSDPNARIAGKSASIVQDCDDDGEQAAGGRLLTLLQILNVVNVMVVVTRWYGGIQLGPARFKHINNAARDSLVKGGFVSDGQQSSSDGPSVESSGKAGKSNSKFVSKNKKRSK